LIISEFKSRDVNLDPYAYAIDVTGETTSELIEQNSNFENRQILTKQEWLNLQSICER
jgi:plasmid maintenance system antidote protein VapI